MMKTRNMIKVLGTLLGFTAILMLVVFVASGFDLNAVYAMFTSPEGISFGFAAGAGASLEGATATTETGDAKSTSLYQDSVRKNITKMKPADTPLDTILQEVGLVVPIKSWESGWYNVDVRDIEDTIATGFDTSSSGTYDSTTGIHTVTVSKPHIWSVDDNMLVQGVNGYDGDSLVLHIVSKNAATGAMGVVPANGLGTGYAELPDIPQGTVITRIGNSKAELDAQTSPYTIYPQKVTNYVQIHMAQVEQSVYDKLHEKEVSWDMADYRMLALYDMRRSMELASLFGAKAKVYDPVAEDYKYMSGGITRMITKSVEYTPSALTDKKVIGWSKNIFVGNSGSDTRFLFAGSTLMSNLASVSSIAKQIESKETEVIFGIRFNRIETNFGVLLVKHHNLFNNVGWASKGLVIDPAHLEKHVFDGMKTRELDLISSGVKKANAQVIEETFCIATRYPDTHAIIEPATS